MWDFDGEDSEGGAEAGGSADPVARGDDKGLGLAFSREAATDAALATVEVLAMTVVPAFASDGRSKLCARECECRF